MARADTTAHSAMTGGAFRLNLSALECQRLPRHSELKAGGNDAKVVENVAGMCLKADLGRLVYSAITDGPFCLNPGALESDKSCGSSARGANRNGAKGVENVTEE